MKDDYKEGDLVFIANQFFDDWCDYKSGDVGIVDFKLDICKTVYINRGPERDRLVIDSRAVKKYNKRNWCKTFLEFMDEQ